MEYPRPCSPVAKRACLKLANMLMIDKRLQQSTALMADGRWTSVIHKCSETLCKELRLDSKAISQFMLYLQLTASHMQQAAVLRFYLTMRSSSRAGTSWSANQTQLLLLHQASLQPLLLGPGRFPKLLLAGEAGQPDWHTDVGH